MCNLIPGQHLSNYHFNILFQYTIFNILLLVSNNVLVHVLKVSFNTHSGFYILHVSCCVFKYHISNIPYIGTFPKHKKEIYYVF